MQRQLACVKVQLEYEQQRALLQQELEALREAMQHSQREVHFARKQLSQKVAHQESMECLYAFHSGESPEYESLSVPTIGP